MILFSYFLPWIWVAWAKTDGFWEKSFSDLAILKYSVFAFLDKKLALLQQAPWPSRDSVLDQQSSGPGFASRSEHYLDLFLGSTAVQSLSEINKDIDAQLISYNRGRSLKDVLLRAKLRNRLTHALSVNGLSTPFYDKWGMKRAFDG